MDSSSSGDGDLYNPAAKQQPQYNEIDGILGDPLVAPSSPQPSSSQHNSASFMETLDWNILGEVGVDTDPLVFDGRTPYFRNESNPVNAVHMHVQENARIPNYNRPVDRSNSSNLPNISFSNSGSSSSQWQALPSNQWTSVPRNSYTDLSLTSNIDQENSMAEMFLNLESKYRRSVNQSYEVIGALCSDEFNLQKDADEDAAVSVDPTPWSEIENKMQIEGKREQHHEQRQQSQAQQNQQQEAQQSRTATATAPAPTHLSALASVPELVATDHPHQSSYYPYGRHHQLPIPGRSSPLKEGRVSPSVSDSTAGQGVEGLAAAIATAAAIACTTNTVPQSTNIDVQSKENATATETETETETAKVSATRSVVPVVNKATANNPRSAAGQPNGSNHSIAKARIAHLQRQRANANPPPHAAAHAVSRASVLAATNRKSQYGFGGNHTVLSVPAPPSVRSVAKPTTDRKPKQITTTPKKDVTVRPPSPATNYQIPSSGSPSPATPNGRHPILPIVNNTGSAYERKKQKAKDARVKLNEAIERCSVAVSLAGSQSRSRIEQLQNVIRMTEFRQKSIQVNEEGIKLAENAKKWDRPSFVGTAASVIQSLNAQCEALMAELGAMQRLLDASQSNNGDSCSNGNCQNQAEGSVVVKSPAMNSLPSNEVETEGSNTRIQETKTSPSHKRNEQPSDLIKSDQTPNKRPRVDSKAAKNLPSKEEIIYSEVAKMLDPASLCRCICVSKTWKGMKVFKDNGTWLSLAVNRFGFYNVRQWSENLKDGEDEQPILCNKHLYKKMNAANVMPHFSQEGLSLLGNGTIPNKISAWAFLVERSNGETLRSVKREPNSGVSGVGAYQSRPVVELRIVVQNTGMASQPVILKSQQIGVDVSTRRKGGEFEEISWDDRFKKLVRNMDGTIRPAKKVSKNGFQVELCRLELFEAVVLEVHINARGCSTISKFQQRSNFTKVLVSLDGTTVPMVIPFLKLE
eukprot:jgi/Psemu1/294703/fgenesh1_pm.28_\